MDALKDKIEVLDVSKAKVDVMDISKGQTCCGNKWSAIIQYQPYNLLNDTTVGN